MAHMAGASEGIVSPTWSLSTQLDDDASDGLNGLGATISPVLTRTVLDPSRIRSLGHLQSPGVMKKVKSTGKVKATARIVSDQYRRVVSGPERPVISQPVGGRYRRAAFR